MKQMENTQINLALTVNFDLIILREKIIFVMLSSVIYTGDLCVSVLDTRIINELIIYENWTDGMKSDLPIFICNDLVYFKLDNKFLYLYHQSKSLFMSSLRTKICPRYLLSLLKLIS